MLKVKEAAKQLNISPRAMYDLAAPEGPIPCHRVGRTGRAVRFEQSDIDSYKQSCRYTTTKNQDAGASRLIASSTDGASGLQNFFQKAGLKPRLKPTAKKKKTDSSPLRLVPEAGIEPARPLSGKRRILSYARTPCVTRKPASLLGYWLCIQCVKRQVLRGLWQESAQGFSAKLEA